MNGWAIAFLVYGLVNIGIGMAYAAEGRSVTVTWFTPVWSAAWLYVFWMAVHA